MTLAEAIDKGIEIACKAENVVYATTAYRDGNLWLKFFVNEEHLSINTLMRRDHIIYWLWYVKLPRDIQKILRFSSIEAPVVTVYSESTITLPISRLQALLGIDEREIYPKELLED